MKKEWLPVALSVLSIFPLISAQSITSALQGIDPNLIVSAILFVLFFAIFYFSASKIFTYKSHNPWTPNKREGNKAVAAVVALALSALVVYGLNTISGAGNFVSGIISNIGISSGTLYTIGSLLFIGLIIFLFAKLRILAFYIIGGIFIIASITGWTFGVIYNSSLSLIIGLALEFIGVIASLIKHASKKGKITYNKRSGHIQG